MYYLSTNKTLIKKQCKKWLSSKRCHFVKKYFYSIKLLHANVQCVYIVCTKYQDVSVKAVEQVEFPVYALPMQHEELQRAITPIKLPLALIINVHLIDINVPAKFDEFPSLPFQDIKEKPKRHGRTDGRTERQTDGRTDGQRENSIPPHKHSLWGI